VIVAALRTPADEDVYAALANGNHQQYLSRIKFMLPDQFNDPLERTGLCWWLGIPVLEERPFSA
jgi:hypothetical protein